MSIEKGCLYVVATPIGNLGDMSPRAIEVLKGVDHIAAEDTRHSTPLLRHFGITTPLMALHEHNEAKISEALVRRLQAGEAIAVISDAGTPLVSDPGYVLVRRAREEGIKVVPVPGPSALITALSVAGLPTDRFSFEGFLPAKSGARRKRLEALAAASRTLVFYEAPHRIRESLEDMAALFGADRPAALARELTKTYETVRSDTLAALAAWVADDHYQQKGEIVVVVQGAPQAQGPDSAEVDRLLTMLLKEVPLKQAVRLAVAISGAKKNEVYGRAVALQEEETPAGD